jgi:hypothetical protein
VSGKAINNSTVSVVRLDGGPNPHCCAVVYFAPDGNSAISGELVGAYASNALTISDAKAFLDLGGAVRLVLADGRMSFEFSLEALQRSGVTVSSKLLRFGQMRPRRGGGS